MNRWILLIACLFSLFIVSAKDIPAKPNPPRLINDYSGVLSSEENNALEQKLVSYFDSTSTQITIVIENSLEDDDLFDYCQRLATAWGIGEKGKNNGLLIYVAVNDRKVRIHTGYGMEATVTDAITTRIRLELINPNFKAGNYYEGLDEATDAIIKAAAGEYKGEGKSVKKLSFKTIFKIIVIVIVIIVFFSRFGGGGRGRRRGGIAGPLFWGGTLGSGGFSSGGGFGGGGGGGFGGFGGGGFGGGGSGGNW